MELKLKVAGVQRTVAGMLFACDLWACGALVLEVGFSAGEPVAFVGIGGVDGTVGKEHALRLAATSDGVEIAAIGNGRPEALAALLRKAGEVLEARIAARNVGARVVGEEVKWPLQR